MSEQIADLVIKIGADSTELTEQAGRVERMLDEQARKEEISRKRQQDYLDRLARKAEESAQSQQKSIQEVEKQTLSTEEKISLQRQQTLSELDAIHNRIGTLITAEAERQQKAKDQEYLAEVYYRQLDAVTKYGGGLEQLRAIQQRLHADQRNGNLLTQDYQALVSHAAGQVNALNQAEETSAQAKKRFIDSLKQQVVQQKLSRTEMLEYKAAQLDVSSAADIYIKKLKESAAAAEDLNKKSKGLTSNLKGLIGQIGGPAGSLLRGGIWGALATGVTGLAKAAYDAEGEFTRFNKQLILTGGYANKTADQLNYMAKSLAGSGIARYEMAASISNVVGTGVFSNNEISRVSKAAAQLNYITGQAVDTTISQFKRLQDEPLKVSMELEKANHHLTAAQLEQIRTLELQGNKTQAARLAIDAYAQSINDGAGDINNNLGALELGWLGVKNAAKGAWNAMLDIGRPESIDEKIKAYEQKLIDFQVNPAAKGLYYNETGKMADDLEKELAILKEDKFQKDLTEAQERGEKNREQLEVKRFNINRKWDAMASWEERRKIKLAELEADKWALTPEAYEDRKFMINFKLRDRQMPGSGGKIDAGTKAEEAAQAELMALQSRLKMLEQHSKAEDLISQQRKDLFLEQAKFDVLDEASRNRQLTAAEKSLLANKSDILAHKEKLATMGDQVARQEKLNQLSDQADKYSKQQLARQTAITDSLGKSNLELQRALEIEQLRSVYGDTPLWGQVSTDKQKTFEVEDDARKNWLAGMETSWGNYRDTVTDVNSQIQNVTDATLSGFGAQISSVLVDGEANFRDFTKSILKMLVEIAVKMAIVKGFEAFGFGAAAPVANANGGVYQSASLSAYSGQVVSSPTMFAFARGAGLMGEAGPEAILPLRRGADGKLGVVAENLRQNNSGVTQVYNINIQNDGSNGEIGPQAVQGILKLVEQKTKQVMANERRDGGSF